ncbi:MAG: hypothetical protein QG594_626, partial [Bacteroidota bacterium]|nr:hypothetical protein [Bacteroidota bacterium]
LAPYRLCGSKLIIVDFKKNFAP